MAGKEGEKAGREGRGERMKGERQKERKLRQEWTHP